MADRSRSVSNMARISTTIAALRDKRAIRICQSKLAADTAVKTLKIALFGQGSLKEPGFSPLKNKSVYTGKQSIP